MEMTLNIATTARITRSIDFHRDVFVFGDTEGDMVGYEDKRTENRGAQVGIVAMAIAMANLVVDGRTLSGHYYLRNQEGDKCSFWGNN